MKSSKTGFTLIELLVVIAIIAVLLAILMPSLRKVRQSAKSTVCQAHLTTWAKAFLMYTNESNNFFPSVLAGSGGLYGQWTLALKPYYGKETRMWFCPLATKAYIYQAKEPYAAWVVEVSQTGDLRPGDYGSYGINAWTYNITNDVQGNNTSTVFSHKYAWKSISAKTPGNVPIFGDCMWRGGFPEDDDTPQTAEDIRDMPPNDGESMRYFNLNRHQGATNLIFMDFSVRKVPLKQLWRLKWNRNYNIARPSPVWPDWMASMAED